MAMVAFLFVFCLMSYAPAFHGVEVDQVTSAGEPVKGAAAQLDARAKKVETLFVTQLEANTKEIVPKLQVTMHQVTSTDAGMQLQAKGKNKVQLVIQRNTGGQATDGIGRLPDAERKLSGTSKYEKSSQKGIKVTRFRNLFEDEACPEDEPCKDEETPNFYCVQKRCSHCDTENTGKCVDYPATE